VIYPGEETAGAEPQMDKKKSTRETNYRNAGRRVISQRSIYHIFSVEEDQ